MSNATVISIGEFSGNSWGCQRNPIKVYEYFAVDCPAYRSAIASHNLAAQQPYIHLHRAAAQRQADEINGVGAKAALAIRVTGNDGRPALKIVEPIAVRTAIERKKTAGYQYRHDVVIIDESEYSSKRRY
jgi:hypothetical protein